MKITEIVTQRFFLDENAKHILEAYSDPESELKIEFKSSEVDPRTFYGYVYEIATDSPIIQIVFTFDTSSSVNVGNIIPVTGTNIVHTSLGTQHDGADMGLIAIRWIFKKIKEFAKLMGFEIRTIKSSTRYTGARAKNNPGDIDGMPKNFDINQKVTEVFTYDCLTDILT